MGFEPMRSIRPADLKSAPLDQLGQSGNARCWVRTSDPPINSRMLWPAELTKRKTFLSDIQHSCVCVDVSKREKMLKQMQNKCLLTPCRATHRMLLLIFPKGYRQYFPKATGNIPYAPSGIRTQDSGFKDPRANRLH